MENEIAKETPRMVSLQDVLDFNQACPQLLGGYTYTPFVVISENSNIGFEMKTYLVIGSRPIFDSKHELFIITIGKAVYPGAKWHVINKSKVIVNDELLKNLDFDYNDIHVKKLGNDEPNRFNEKYPTMIGVTKQPISHLLIGKKIGGKDFYIAKVTIMNVDMTSFYEILPY